MNTKYLGRGVLGASLVLAAVALAYWGLSTPPPVAAPVPMADAAPATTPAEASAAAPAASEQAEVLAQQKTASDAAARAVGTAPYRGAVTERPEFVSAIEWQILKAAAALKPDSAQNLTRMVNQLRFEKQQEIWQQLPADADPAQRTALAQQLLQEVPERVANGEMDISQARQLQGALLAQLETDPQRRSTRIRDEAAKLHTPPATPAPG